MRAHAAASAVGTHGSTLPPTHAPPANIATRSLASKVSALTDAGKLGNENPSVSGRRVVETDDRSTESDGRVTNSPAPRPTTATAATICTTPNLRFFNAPKPANPITSNSSAPPNRTTMLLPLSGAPPTGSAPATTAALRSIPIDKLTTEPLCGRTATSICVSLSPMSSRVSPSSGLILVHSCTPDCTYTSAAASCAAANI